MWKFFFVLITAGTIFAATKGKKVSPFAIDIQALWNEKKAIVTVKHNTTVVMSTPISMNSNSAESFGKQFEGHFIKLTRILSKNAYTIEIFYKNKLMGGNLIDFNSNQVINIT